MITNSNSCHTNNKQIEITEQASVVKISINDLRTMVCALRAENEKLRKVVDCYREMEKQDRYAEKVGAMDAYIDAHRARDAAHHARLAGRRAMELLDADAALDAGKEE